MKTPSYIDLIKRFWTLNNTAEFTPVEIALYFWLLHECNRQGWPAVLRYSNKKVCLALNLSESTMIRARAALAEKGALAFDPGARRKSPPAYMILPSDCSASAPLQHRFCPQFYFQNESKNESNSESKSASKTDNIIYKTKDYKTNSRETRAREDQFLEDFFDTEKLKTRQEVCMALRIDEAKLLALAREVYAEWSLANLAHEDYTDFARHLISQTRIKLTATTENQNRNATANPHIGNSEDAMQERARLLADELRGDLAASGAPLP